MLGFVLHGHKYKLFSEKESNKWDKKRYKCYIICTCMHTVKTALSTTRAPHGRPRTKTRSWHTSHLQLVSIISVSKVDSGEAAPEPLNPPTKRRRPDPYPWYITCGIYWLHFRKALWFSSSWPASTPAYYRTPPSSSPSLSVGGNNRKKISIKTNGTPSTGSQEKSHASPDFLWVVYVRVSLVSTPDARWGVNMLNKNGCFSLWGGKKKEKKKSWARMLHPFWSPTTHLCTSPHALESGMNNIH